MQHTRVPITENMAGKSKCRYISLDGVFFKMLFHFVSIILIPFLPISVIFINCP